jgi:DAACS family dicarboxylate/amino acid:cation (Na+ or H+) symporter
MERLPLKILAGLLIGAVLAALLGDEAMRFRWAAEPAGTIFIRLLLSLVLPLAMSALVLAVAELQPSSLVGMGGRLVGLTVGLTSVAVAIGVGLVQLFKPGVGIDRATLPAAGVVTPATGDAVTAVMDIFPGNAFKAASEGNMIAVLGRSWRM